MNPYQPPNQHGASESREASTRLPQRWVTEARWAIGLLTLLSIGLPLLLAPLVDGFRINLFSPFLVFVGLAVNEQSFKSFPWTIVVCLMFTLDFVGECWEFSLFEIRNWLPTPGSPILALRLACAMMGLYTAQVVWKCHRRHLIGVANF